MKMRLVLIIVGLLLAGCGRSVNVDKPPEIVYGQDVCSRCNMIISEEKHAAAYWTVDGDARLFDDAGGMFVYQQETQEEVASYWVHDLQTGNWLRAKEAYFVYDPSQMTPMGFGLVAMADEAAARALVHGQNGAVVMDFAALTSGLEDGSLVLGPMDMGMGMK